MKALRYGLIAAALLATAACSTLGSGDRGERIIVQASVMTLIERSGQPAAKATKVLEAIAQVQTLLLDDSTNVARLRTALTDRVAERDLQPSEKLIALEVINSISDAVEKRLGEGFLSPEAIVSVNAVLDWVKSVAVLYVQNPTSG